MERDFNTNDLKDAGVSNAGGAARRLGTACRNTATDPKVRDALGVLGRTLAQSWRDHGGSAALVDLAADVASTVTKRIAARLAD